MRRYEHLPQLEELPSRKKIVVFSGAGISKESGAETYRDLDGLWRRYDPEVIATPEGFQKNMSFVLDFYNKMRKMLLEIKPNHAHKMIAELEKWHDVTVITQNIDNLHERAGSTKVIHLHGELSKVTSTKNHLDPDCVEEIPLNRGLKVGDRAKDGSQLRPYIVWFGEDLDDLNPAIDAMLEADVLLVIGTSLTVMPAAGLITYTRNATVKYCIDPGQLRLPADFTFINEKATEGIDDFVDAMAK